MSEDNSALLLKIGELAGQINRHKNNQDTGAGSSIQHNHLNQNPTYYSRARGHSYRSHVRSRGRGGRIPVAHHHRTLVIKNNNKPFVTNSSRGSEKPLPSSNIEIVQTSSNDPVESSGEGWVAKRDRHIQLIKGSLYEQQAHTRAKAIATSLQDRLRRKEEKEKYKFNHFLQSSRGLTQMTQTSDHVIVVGGETYRVSTNGSKLIRMSGNSVANQTPKNAVIGGVRFNRSKNGNLWRAGLIRASRLKSNRESLNEPCKYYSLSGNCKNGLSCPYIHNPNQVAICPRFLTSDSCPDGNMCDLSHDPTPHRVPACHHFLRGKCSNSNCRYAHVRVNPGASICRAFATLGYCSNGAECTMRHAHECPEFDDKGVCGNTKCKLPHIERAGRRRAAVANTEKTPIPQDIRYTTTQESSEDEEDESDVDSDILDEYNFIRTNEESEDAAVMEHDFIKF